MRALRVALCSIAVSVVASTALFTPSAFAAASAAGGAYTGMDTCPLRGAALRDPSNLQVGCVVSVTNGGSVTIGATTVPLASPITLRFGVYWPASAPVLTFPDGSTANVYTTVPPTDGRTLTAAPLQVDIPGIANVIPGVTSVFAQVETAGPITAFVPLATGENTPAFVLPIKLHLLNLLFGPTCYVGSDAHPILLSPTTGTTSPPPPASPVTGDPGVIGVQADPNGYQAVVASFAGATLVDNSAAVPSATGCGLLNPLINLSFGLPSAAGHNAVVFSSTNTSLAIDSTITDLSNAIAASR